MVLGSALCWSQRLSGLVCRVEVGSRGALVRIRKVSLVACVDGYAVDVGDVVVSGYGHWGLPCLEPAWFPGAGLSVAGGLGSRAVVNFQAP